MPTFELSAELLNDPAVWVSFLTLTVLEIVLGIDNIIFISIVANKLPRASQAAARFVGLLGALVLRLALLFAIAWIVRLTTPILGPGADVPDWLARMSWRDLILLAGGLFLIWKATGEIHSEFEPRESRQPVAAAAFGAAIGQIMLLDVVFSLDSVITAVGIAEHLEVMYAAVIIAVLVMMVAAGPISRFIERNPSTKMLALAFLIMIGAALVADGLGFHIDRGYLYGAMAFSLLVEILNLARGRGRGRGRRRAARAAAE